VRCGNSSVCPTKCHPDRRRDVCICSNFLGEKFNSTTQGAQKYRPKDNCSDEFGERMGNMSEEFCSDYGRKRNGNEWSYQKHAQVSRESGGYATILILGGSTSGFEQSSKTMTLIIKFDAQKVVSDFKSMYSSF